MDEDEERNYWGEKTANVIDLLAVNRACHLPSCRDDAFGESEAGAVLFDQGRCCDVEQQTREATSQGQETSAVMFSLKSILFVAPNFTSLNLSYSHLDSMPCYTSRFKHMSEKACWSLTAERRVPHHCGCGCRLGRHRLWRS